MYIYIYIMCIYIYNIYIYIYMYHTLDYASTASSSGIASPGISIVWYGIA